MRLQDRPTLRASASVTFPTSSPARAAVRAIARPASIPSNCRLLDARRGDDLRRRHRRRGGARARLRVGRPPARRLDGARARVLPRSRRPACRRAPARRAATRRRRATARPAPGARRSSARRTCATRWSRMGMISETFETAITWDRFAAFHAAVMAATAGRRASASAARARSPAASPTSTPTVRRPTTRVIAPAPARRASSSSGREIKAAASEVLLALGGTITHHHAVGRDHRPWYDRQRPERFAARAARREARRSTRPAS